jgi:hypothetical protein
METENDNQSILTLNTNKRKRSQTKDKRQKTVNKRPDKQQQKQFTTTTTIVPRIIDKEWDRNYGTDFCTLFIRISDIRSIITDYIEPLSRIMATIRSPLTKAEISLGCCLETKPCKHPRVMLRGKEFGDSYSLGGTEIDRLAVLNRIPALHWDKHPFTNQDFDNPCSIFPSYWFR